MAVKNTLRGALLVAISIFSIAALSGNTEPDDAKANPCSVDTEQMLSLSPDSFDQDLNGGWRVLAAKSGCEKAAAELILAYISHNWGKIEQRNLHVMYWHVGQMEAFAGNDRQAIPLMMAGVNPAVRSRQLGFYEYALGTIAFLNRDMDGLKAARERLAALPEPSWFREEYTEKYGLNWPANLSVLDNLIQCYDYPYSVAYSGGCRPDNEQ